ncbi:dihydrolipoamide acetyltransferase family protein [Urechidicola vernalis]|uniref:Dihydrolipoamide acetyltransferase component of pyruvate dehydrogenase complex n=1 Tax=Urechidicola vernalis TaxID=3075600 RepID=A0ABU2Y2F2_9FLAO|nr:dihydrolipoamide acetyltransferase family protein [Urechidicola sp. P050]MDT0552346.1 dihydrolipoamide acetyltransferase family protein [Urechidicola sp. P050]
MAKFELKLPKMGESVAEATITAWLKEVGDTIELDDSVVEIATDKVDSEVPSEVEGVLLEKRFEKDDVVQVGETIAIIETEGEVGEDTTKVVQSSPVVEAAQEIEKTVEVAKETVTTPIDKTGESGKFYSPLVRNIAEAEGVSMEELESLAGSGKDGRVTKADILGYIEKRSSAPKTVESPQSESSGQTASKPITAPKQTTPLVVSGEDEIIEMSRMGKLIAKHMVDSIQTAAHVQSFIEVDVTNVAKWRTKVKDQFLAREGEKLTFTPIFMQAVAQALKQFPLINISTDGETVVKKKNINLGMATALPDGNLIVPVIKNADQLNLVGMAKAVNALANKARTNSLSPDDIQGGTYTVTNVGGFGSVMGTPIINQPQVGILALGAIRKMPAVIETSEGDFIGIRQKMYLSHSYDHRVVNGALGGMFIKHIKEYLEAWDVNAAF